jgi:hypothetical protein
MKISDKELKAALVGFQSRGTFEDCMRKALEAAYTVRAARKAAKRAKAKPSVLDEDQQEALGKPKQPEHRFKVGDRVVHSNGAYGAGVVEKIDTSDIDNPYEVRLDSGLVCRPYHAFLSPESVKPEWNGKFEVGKAYRTRDGRRVDLDENRRASEKYPLVGRITGVHGQRTWTDSGFIQRYTTDGFDLISPWED